METMAAQIYGTQYQAIRDLISQAAQGNVAHSRQLAEEMIGRLPGLSGAPSDIQVLFFAEALRKRFDPDAEAAGNLYLLSEDGGQQIKTFNFMAEKFPLVRFSQEITNNACLRELHGEAQATILDIGIGMGQQMVRLLAEAFCVEPALKQVTVIGIEPAIDSLNQAKASLLELAQKHNVNLTFEAIPKSIEGLTEQDWLNLETISHKKTGKLLINAAFALHHIRPVSLRSELFVRLKRFSPHIFTLIEPYADFLEPDLLTRFSHAWHHYGLVFQAIDQIEALPEEKSRVKTFFFRPEIQDVLSEEQHRVEQFETGEMWLSRLVNAGFKLFEIGDASLNIPNCPFVKISRQNNYLTLDVGGFPILSIMAAR